VNIPEHNHADGCHDNSCRTAEIHARSSALLLANARPTGGKATQGRWLGSRTAWRGHGWSANEWFYRVAYEAGVDARHIHHRDSLELPGYFRPSKRWDFLVVPNGQLIAALETKSQVGPSFGNNFNNRTEEAMGTALDLWTAFREQAFGSAIRPWIGYLFLLEDCASSTRPVGVKEPHFKVFPEFRDSSYAKRYELFCRRLVLERHYDSSAFLMSSPEKGAKGGYSEPAPDLSFQTFASSLVARVATFSGRIKRL
jgi:hypothetical protein